VSELQSAFDALLAVLASLHEQISELTRKVRRLEREDADVGLLTASLPGVGAQSAATLLAELGDPHRFRNARAVAAYAGLVPRVSQSADRAHHGRMTKQGNPELRWILSQWAVRLMKDDPRVAEWAARLRKRVHTNKARMALARRLLVGVWIMITRGETFDLDRCLGIAEAEQPHDPNRSRSNRGVRRAADRGQRAHLFDSATPHPNNPNAP
jgi:transposase